jgi:hypothetical protein
MLDPAGSSGSESKVKAGVLALMEMAGLREARSFSVEAPYRSWPAAPASNAAKNSGAARIAVEFPTGDGINSNNPTTKHKQW